MTWLTLDNTQITDKAVESLKKLGQLQLLDMVNTKVSNKKYAELRKALSSVKVRRQR